MKEILNNNFIKILAIVVFFSIVMIFLSENGDGTIRINEGSSTFMKDNGEDAEIEAYILANWRPMTPEEDIKFQKFIEEKIHTVCPEYIPDGATYRGCLWDLMSKYRADFKGSANDFKAIEYYCEGVSAEFYPGNSGGDTYMACIMYKINQENSSK